MKKTAVYLRCSAATQSNESQRFELEQYLGSQVVCGRVEWYEDAAVTGTNLERPALQRLHRDIVDGEVEMVVVWKLDRLSRSIADGVKLLSDWVARDVRVVAVTQQIDLSGPLGRMVASLLLGIAEMERQYLRERQAAGIARAKAAGVRLGRPRKTEPSLIRRLKSEGASVAQIARRLKVSRQTVYNSLNEMAA